MLRAVKQEARVRGDVEGRLAQTVVVQIHDRSLARFVHSGKENVRRATGGERRAEGGVCPPHEPGHSFSKFDDSLLYSVGGLRRGGPEFGGIVLSGDIALQGAVGVVPER